MQVHKFSVVHPNATLGKNVVVEAFVTIEEDVIIGDNCTIMSNAVIKSGTRIGDNCKVYHGAVLGAPPQDLKYAGEPTTLEIGNNTVIREYCTLNKGTAAYKKTVVGNNCLLMAYVHIAHDCVVGNHCVFANNATLAGHVEVGDFVILGGLVAIQQFVKIGAHAMLGGGTLLNKDVPPYVRVARYPASYIGVNSIGLVRRGFDRQVVRTIQDAYHHLLVGSQNLSKGIAAIEADMELTTEIKGILDFVHESKNGIVKGLKNALSKEG